MAIISLSDSEATFAVMRSWRGLLAVLIAFGVMFGAAAHAADKSAPEPAIDAPTAILIDALSGAVLFERNADELRAPSSMMKLMTAEVVFNAIKMGDLKPTQRFPVSENAWRKGGPPSGEPTMLAVLNSRISVDDLLHGAIIQNANDACIILAEGISGNEKAFAGMMSNRARELGLTKSTFANSSGLPDTGNMMTVRELAKLARHIILTYPEFYRLFGEREFIWNKVRQLNRNPLLTSLDGADGLKSGFTKDGGYGMVGSALQNGKRLIVVVNGLDDPDDRDSEAKKMLEWGFQNYDGALSKRDQPTVGPSAIVAEPPPKPVAAVHGPTIAEKRVALVIGNSSYKNVARLPNPQRDAAAVAAALRQTGFRSVVLLSDLGLEKTLQALRDFAREADGADWAVVYFAGHGIEVGGTNYLIPVDAALTSDRDVSLEAVALDQVLTVVSRASKLRIVILDACRNNPFDSQMKRSVATRAVSRGLARIEPSDNTIVAYAAKAGETATDGDNGNSPFATALIRNLQTPGLEV
jgi:D-alanyl-D-alanine carboxypeptidase (penicillin-binding protein 5/6)